MTPDDILRFSLENKSPNTPIDIGVIANAAKSSDFLNQCISSGHVMLCKDHTKITTRLFDILVCYDLIDEVHLKEKIKYAFRHLKAHGVFITQVSANMSSLTFCEDLAQRFIIETGYSIRILDVEALPGRPVTIRISKKAPLAFLFCGDSFTGKTNAAIELSNEK